MASFPNGIGEILDGDQAALQQIQPQRDAAVAGDLACKQRRSRPVAPCFADRISR